MARRVRAGFGLTQRCARGLVGACLGCARCAVALRSGRTIIVVVSGPHTRASSCAHAHDARTLSFLLPQGYQPAMSIAMPLSMMQPQGGGLQPMLQPPLGFGQGQAALANPLALASLAAAGAGAGAGRTAELKEQERVSTGQIMALLSQAQILQLAREQQQARRQAAGPNPAQGRGHKEEEHKEEEHKGAHKSKWRSTSVVP